MPRKTVFGLYGAGGFAREVMAPWLDVLATDYAQSGNSVFFIETSPKRETVNGVSVISEEAFFALEAEDRLFNVAIADSRARQRIAETCIARGAKPHTIALPSSSAHSSNEIGEGAILCGNVIVTANARIGRFFHANIYSYVAHDCVIGDFVTFAPRVCCNGNVHIEGHAYIGTGAMLRQGESGRPLVIGEGAIVGMGAVVTKDVAPFTTVVGNPARPMAAT